MNSGYIRIIFSFVFLFAFSPFISGQQFYRIYFTDKNYSEFNIRHPKLFLSEKSIKRREKHCIPIGISDLPVSAYYISMITNIGAHILCKSKWLNYVVADFDDVSIVNQIEDFCFVRYVIPLSRLAGSKIGTCQYPLENIKSTTSRLTCNGCGDYGYSDTQIKMLKTDFLHKFGFTGKGMIIAVLDAGFSGVDTMSAFSCMRSQHHILCSRDFVEGSKNVYHTSSHGTKVLGLMGAQIEATYSGISPDADFILIRTEDVFSESPIEEDYWLAGAEYADSIGADIINSSLGYFNFDDTLNNLTYNDLDGNSTIITRAADIAASKGILVVNAAGNEGDKPWHYIIAPADGDSVLAVGSVDLNGIKTPGSSFGPTADLRIKPEVVAPGKASAVILPNGVVGFENGTSFAAPLISGSAACLWQAATFQSNMELISAILMSSSNSSNPDNETGFGIPDFKLAYQSITGNYSEIPSTDSLCTYPDPVTDILNIDYFTATEQIVVLRIYNQTGQLIYNKELLPECCYVKNQLHTDNLLQAGLYFICMITDNSTICRKVIKVNTNL